MILALLIKKFIGSADFSPSGENRKKQEHMEAITREQMRKFLKSVHDDNVYCKYYEVVCIFHTGLRISEFCGLTLRDIDLENKILNIDHQLQRTANMKLVIESTKTNAGTRKLPMTEDVVGYFRASLGKRVLCPASAGHFFIFYTITSKFMLEYSSS